MPTVATANVNGVRAASAKGFLDWLARSDADAVCLQETRALAADLPVAFLDLLARESWHLTLEPALAKGRNGVAVLTRQPPLAVRTGIGAAEFDGTGRYVEVDLAVDSRELTVASLYLPKGQAGTAKQEQKDRFLAAFARYLGERWAKAAADGREPVPAPEMIVAGDFNIAPTERDLRNWKGNARNSGFLPHERAWIGELLGSGWTDAVRAVHPGVDGPYTWWAYRGRAFDKDVGWRIDHVLSTVGLKPVTAWVDRAPGYDVRWSDHAPVSVRFVW